MKIKNAVLLLLTAAIWGIAFVAQSVGMDYVGPLTFNCVRSLIGGVVLLPCIWFFCFFAPLSGAAFCTHEGFRFLKCFEAFIYGTRKTVYHFFAIIPAVVDSRNFTFFYCVEF